MPQSTPERRARWQTDTGAIEFLRSRGYRLTSEFSWIASGREPDADEQDAIIYLIEEWDFGGIEPGS